LVSAYIWRHRFVVWPRCDQKTCVKAVLAAGLQLVVVPNLLEGDQVRTDVGAVQRAIEAVSPACVVCVLSTTSCFAPRAADRVLELAQLCAATGCGHIINNAYGVQSAMLCAAITAACRRGRVDAIVQSTDKNFCVPVGGSVVASPKSMPGLVADVNAAYPGRASIAPLLDVLLTLLHWGASGWRAALQAREEVFPYLRERMGHVALQHGAGTCHAGCVLSLIRTAQANGCWKRQTTPFLSASR
jgi:O-phospho-L-seryl-tRNASec:L-selenocysteinyl-tRNA synthase